MRDSRVVWLNPIYFPYMVPIFDELHRALDGRFTVVSLQQRSHVDHVMPINAAVAQTSGSFPRRLVRGHYFNLSRDASRGTASPLGMLVTPSLPRLLSDLAPDAVIVTNFSTWTLTSLLMGYRTTVFWEGWSHTERTVKPWRTRLRKWMCNRAHSIVAQGELSKRYLVNQLDTAEDRIRSPGICAHPPPSEYAGVPRKRTNGGPVRFLSVSRLTPGKGLDHLLHAVAQLVATGASSAFEVAIVGDGPERGRLRQLAAQLGLERTVRFEGYVHPSKVWRHYAEADVFVFPTLQDYWGLVAAEAASMGLPLLLSRFAGSAADLVDEGRNGFSFEPLEHRALARLMAVYVDEPHRIRQHGVRSLEISASYTPQRVAQSFLGAIE